MKAPKVDSVSRDSGSAGQPVTIHGKFFGTERGKVYIGSKSCKVPSWQTETITFAVPKGLVAGNPYDVSVSNAIGSDTLRNRESGLSSPHVQHGREVEEGAGKPGYGS